MTENQIELIYNFKANKISKEEFLEKFNYSQENLLDFLQFQIDNLENIKETFDLIFLLKLENVFLKDLNQLLLNPNHFEHQFITLKIQKIANPSSIEFIDKALENAISKDFENFNYTGSEAAAISKWFSWALFAIGTKEAIQVLKKYSNSKNEMVKEEMIYRLSKM